MTELVSFDIQLDFLFVKQCIHLLHSLKKYDLQDEITTHGMQPLQNIGSDILEKYLRAYFWKQVHACSITKKGQEKLSKRAQFWIFTPHFFKFGTCKVVHLHKQLVIMEFLVKTKAFYFSKWVLRAATAHNKRLKQVLHLLRKVRKIWYLRWGCIMEGINFAGGSRNLEETKMSNYKKCYTSLH